MAKIVLIAHNLRSSHNVGSLMRTAEGLGIEKLYLTGYAPYPRQAKDKRLPHLASKVNAQIHKTALGAEKTLLWAQKAEIEPLLRELKQLGYLICALEQTADATPLPSYKPPAKIAVVVGREVEGLEPEILQLVDQKLVIPMRGQKESFNVVQAAAMALYHLIYVKI